MKPSPRLQSFVGALLPPACPRACPRRSARARRLRTGGARQPHPTPARPPRCCRGSSGVNSETPSACAPSSARPRWCSRPSLCRADDHRRRRYRFPPARRGADAPRHSGPGSSRCVMIGQEIYAPKPWTQTEQMVPILLACGAAGFVQLAFAHGAPAWTLPRLMSEWATINALMYLPIAQFFFPRGRRRRRRLTRECPRTGHRRVRARHSPAHHRRRVVRVRGDGRVCGPGLRGAQQSRTGRRDPVLAGRWLCAVAMRGLWIATPRRPIEAATGSTRERFAEELQRQRQFHGGRVLWQRFFVALPGPLLLGWAQWLAHRDQRAARSPTPWHF